MSFPASDAPRASGLGTAAVALAATIAVAGLAAVLPALLAPPARPAPRLPVLALARAHATAQGAWAAGAARVYAEVDRRMRRAGDAVRTRVARALLEEAARTGVDPLLVAAVIHVESAFDPRAVSPVGAVGLMQLMQPTLAQEAARAGLPLADPFDPAINVRAGVRYLARLQGAFGDLDLALMAYNAGPGRIRSHLRDGGVPSRFHAYPRNVKTRLARLRAAASGPRLAVAVAAAGARAALRAPASAVLARADLATPVAPPVPRDAVVRAGRHEARDGRRARARARRRSARRAAPGPPMGHRASRRARDAWSRTCVR